MRILMPTVDPCSAMQEFKLKNAFKEAFNAMRFKTSFFKSI